MKRRAAVVTLIVSFAAATTSAATAYTPSPVGFDTNGGVIKMQLDATTPKAVVLKGDGNSFQKAGTMKLYQDGVQIGASVSYGVQSQVNVPFSWSFTSGSHSFYAKAFSSDGNVFQSGTISVTATTTPPAATPAIISASVNPPTGVQSKTPFTWTATAKTSDGKSFSTTLWIVQPNGTPVAFPMAPTSGSWSTGMTFTVTKPLISAGNYAFYVVASNGVTQSRLDKSGPTTSINVWPRMTAETSHVGVHLYNDKANLQKLRDQLHLIRTTIPNTTYTTCFQGSSGKKAQLAVQLEFSFADYTKYGMAPLDDAINAAAAEGFAVHLLLSVHDPVPDNYGGYGWPRNWPGNSTFVPYQPAKDAGSGATMCPYDVASNLFHKPVVQHLISNALIDKLAVIYLLNEFDYGKKLQDGEVWPNCTSTPQQCRDEALAYTTARVLAGGRSAVAGRVPVGVKFAAMTPAYSAFHAPATGKPDQLAWLLGSVMAPAKDVLGYDAYWDSGNPFDATNRTRLTPFLSGFTNGNLELSEYARLANDGPACTMDSKSGRTTPNDLANVASQWPVSRGFNLFAFNASGTRGSYAIYSTELGFCTVGGYTGVTGKAELTALGDQITSIIGPSPQPCQ